MYFISMWYSIITQKVGMQIGHPTVYADSSVRGQRKCIELTFSHVPNLYN